MYVTAPNGKTMTLALDTGNSFYATTHRDVLERIGLWESGKPHKYPRMAGVASGAVESWLYQMPPLDIFGVPTPPSVWDIIDLPSSSAEGDGTVGDGFLKHFNITVDYERRRIWLEKWEDEIANAEDGDVGLSAAYNPNTKRTQVVLVAPDSPAAAAGIKVGDSVLMVDGDDLIHVDYDRFRKLMSGKIGTSVRLAVSQNGGLKRVELKRTSLVNIGPRRQARRRVAPQFRRVPPEKGRLVFLRDDLLMHRDDLFVVREDLLMLRGDLLMLRGRSFCGARRLPYCVATRIKGARGSDRPPGRTRPFHP